MMASRVKRAIRSSFLSLGCDMSQEELFGADGIYVTFETPHWRITIKVMPIGGLSPRDMCIKMMWKSRGNIAPMEVVFHTSFQ
jgi:hypothetical protein